MSKKHFSNANSNFLSIKVSNYILLLLKALRYSRKYLPVAARVCLLSMQLEDGFRFLFISDRIAEYHAKNWNAPYGLMLFLNYLRCILQIAATVVCILRIKVEICVGILYGTMLLYVIKKN